MWEFLVFEKTSKIWKTSHGLRSLLGRSNCPQINMHHILGPEKSSYRSYQKLGQGSIDLAKIKSNRHADQCVHYHYLPREAMRRACKHTDRHRPLCSFFHRFLPISPSWNRVVCEALKYLSSYAAAGTAQLKIGSNFPNWNDSTLPHTKQTLSCVALKLKGELEEIRGGGEVHIA